MPVPNPILGTGTGVAPFVNTVRLAEKATFDLKLTKNCQKLISNLITVDTCLTRGE